MPLTLKAPRRSSPPWQTLLASTALLAALFALSLGAGHLVGPVPFGPGHGGATAGTTGMPGMHMNGLGGPALPKATRTTRTTRTTGAGR